MFCTAIPIVDDVIAELDETFTALLSSLNGQFIAVNPASSSATILIRDDDGRSMYTIYICVKLSLNLILPIIYHHRYCI